VPRGGATRTYLSVKAPLYDADGAPYAICGISADITEHKRLLAALEEANRQKDAFPGHRGARVAIAARRDTGRAWRDAAES
jgi:hypothetical protein